MALNDDLRAGITQLSASTQIFQQESSKHEATRKAVVATVDAKAAALQKQVDDGLADRDVLGKGYFGAIHANAASLSTYHTTAGNSSPAITVDADVIGPCYLHLEVDLAGIKNKMVWLRFQGYAYQVNQIINEVATCYRHEASATKISQQKHTNNSLETLFYVNASGVLFLRIKLPTNYLVFLSVDAMALYDKSIPTIKNARLTALTVETI